MIRFLQSIPGKLTRVTSGRKLIKEVDGLRFMAILPVLVQHLAERFERNAPLQFTMTSVDHTVNFLAHRGFLGVYVFFLISGFILALPFASYRLLNTEKVGIGKFYLRRLTRLEPPYIIWMTVFFLIFVFVKNHSFIEYLPHYFANITYTHGLFYHIWSPFNPPTWTLEIEIQFYLLAPLLAYFFFYFKDKNKRRLINFGIIIVIILLQQYFKYYTNPYNLTILGHLHYFLAGFMLADFYLCDWKDIRKTILYDFIGITALLILIYFWSWDYELTSRFIVLMSLFIFFIAVFKSIYLNKFVTNNWVMAIGGMCYTIYLIHLPLAEFFILFTKNIVLTQNYTINLILQLCMFIPVTLLLSSIFFLWFEKPFMNKNWMSNIKNKLFNRNLKSKEQKLTTHE